MIEHIEIEGFKSLEKVSLDLGPLNIFVGTNASGKTNFLEALRVLQGIGYGYTVDEILNGKPKGANTEVWEGIRGGSKFAPPLLAPDRIIEFRVSLSAPSLAGPAYYVVRLSPANGRFLSENLSIDGSLVTPITFAEHAMGQRPALAQINHPTLSTVRELLWDMQPLMPQPSVQRQYSTAGAANRIGDHGENFAALIKTMLRDERRASDYTAWLKELTPAELDSVDVLPGAAGDWMFALRKGGIDYPAPILSDGTLRFAAIAAAFFQSEPPRTLLLEEIEDGLHPTRLQLLMELLKSQAGRGVQQVIATTHSPYTIAWLDEEDYRHVFLFTKDEETGATTVTPFSEVPHLIEVARRHPISDLLVQGWLETAV
jgi:predicted ATPase